MPNSSQVRALCTNFIQEKGFWYITEKLSSIFIINLLPWDIPDITETVITEPEWKICGCLKNL